MASEDSLGRGGAKVARASAISPALTMRLFSLAILASVARGFVWHVNERLAPSSQLVFTEKYMFASNEGPAMMTNGDSFIKLDVKAKIYSPINQTTLSSLVFFGVDDEFARSTLQMACVGQQTDSFALKPMKEFDRAKFVKVIASKDANGAPVYVFEAELKGSYPVSMTRWHNTVVQFCTDTFDYADVKGTITFKNPYGYLPGTFYGYLPFEGARMAALVLFGIAYLFAFYKHWDELLPLHGAILFVLGVAIFEATMWFAAYAQLNTTGEPYCCPFPNIVAASLIFSVLRRTTTRALLLVVCLGYGIVRPKLQHPEWIAVSVITGLYFVASIVDEAATIMRESNVKDDPSADLSVYWEVPAMLLDVVFLTWIYLALSSTVRILQEYQQTFKLQMYKQLAVTIAVFVGLFGVLTIFVLAQRGGAMNWPWQWVWVQSVMWEVLNFGILAAVCMIWRPSDNAKYLSYSSQLPTSDPDEPRFGSQHRGIEMVERTDGDEFDTLPGADDDDEFGLPDDDDDGVRL